MWAEEREQRDGDEEDCGEDGLSVNLQVSRETSAPVLTVLTDSERLASATT